MLIIPDGLLEAARSLWDTTHTLDTAKADNPEYLRGQVETISRASRFDAREMDSDEVKAIIERRIFESPATALIRLTYWPDDTTPKAVADEAWDEIRSHHGVVGWEVVTNA